MIIISLQCNAEKQGSPTGCSPPGSIALQREMIGYNKVHIKIVTEVIKTVQM